MTDLQDSKSLYILMIKKYLIGSILLIKMKAYLEGMDIRELKEISNTISLLSFFISVNEKKNREKYET